MGGEKGQENSSSTATVIEGTSLQINLMEEANIHLTLECSNWEITYWRNQVKIMKKKMMVKTNQLN
jgi:hypothetical protein